MITDIHIETDPEKVDEYFDEHFGPDSAAADYYSQDGQVAGQWFGKAAEHLGLQGEMDRAKFSCLNHNLDPQTRKTLTARHKGDARAAYDPTISAPKSVSVMALVMDDTRIIDAHEKAVTATLAEMEKLIATRVRKNEVDEDRVTGNFVGCRFLHFTSRESDPLLHTHPVFGNVTWDEVEKRYKAIQPSALFHQKKFLTEIYRSVLAAELHRIGYPTVATANGFEIAGVSRDIVEVFSKRQQQIDAITKKLGCNNPAMRDEVAHKYRKSKDTSKTVDKLRPDWLAELSPEQIAQLEKVKAAAIAPVALEPMSAIDALNLAAPHLFERLTVVKDFELFTEALSVSRGRVSLDEIRAVLDSEAQKTDKQTFLVNADEVTTPEALAQEAKMRKFVSDSVGTCEPLAPAFIVPSGITDQMTADERMAANEQKAAAEMLLHACKDRVSALHGPAGAGKSYLIKTLLQGLLHTKYGALVCAPTASAVKDLVEKDNILNAVTLQRFMSDKAMQKDYAGSVIILDEAGMVSTAQMNDLFDLAAKHDCRVILSGDSRQHTSVEAGDALRILERDGKLATATLSTINRQKHDRYKAAIGCLKDGNAKAGFHVLNGLGWIREIKNEDRYCEVADDFIEIQKQKKSCLVVCSNWRESDAVTEYIRLNLKTDKMLGPDDTTVDALHPLQWTRNHLAHARRYKPGMVIVFNRKNKFFAAGEPLTVASVKDGFVVVQKPNGETHLLLPDKVADLISLFEKKPLAVAAGEKLLIRRNGKSENGERLVNGELVDVKAVRPSGEILLADGRSLPADFRHFTHGYAVTSQNAQGKTVDHVLVAINAQSAATISATTFYVAASRGRFSCTIYTDNKANFLYAATRTKERKSASEFVEQQQSPQQTNNTPQNHAQKNTPAAGLRAGKQQQQSLPTVGISAHPAGFHPPGVCQIPGSGTPPLLGPQLGHSESRNPQAGHTEQPNVCGLPGIGSELPDPSICYPDHQGPETALGR